MSSETWAWPRAVTVEWELTKTATGHSVYDGDTFRADVDLGLEIHKVNLPVRLVGLNAPEVKGTTGDVKARALAARDLLRSLLPIGTAIELRAVGYDKYNPRVDARVVRKSDGMDINQAMLDSGLVEVVD